MSHRVLPCRWCGKPARYIDDYRTPFQEDCEIFPESMSLYYCSHESIGFAYPVPTVEDLKKYYNKIYRDTQRLCSEDPHKQYSGVTATPLAESQFMYLSQFLDFNAIQTVIDMGCGHGMLLRQIHEYNQNIRLIGIELDSAVSPFLKDIDTEIIHVSVSENVDVILERIGNDTLLISSHVLHYQHDFRFLYDIIEDARRRDLRNVYLFVEVPNEIFQDSVYVSNRVYDTPKLLFFTVEAFQKGIFDIEIINVTTNGWPTEQELFFRKKRLEEYRKSIRHFHLKKIFHFLKSFFPIRTRMLIKKLISGKNDSNQALFYYSYGGNRRAIRMIGRVV